MSTTYEPTPTRIVVLRTGAPVPAVATALGSFRDHFARGLGVDATDGAPPIALDELDVTAFDADAPLPSTASWDGAIMTGSPAYVGDDAPWMRWGARLLRHLLDADIPFLGVCFGHQLLGVACGADVGPNPRGREMGTVAVTLGGDAVDDELFAGLPMSFRAQVTHRDVVRAPGPRLRVLAAAPHDPHHAVRAGRRQWGVQFHPEFDDVTMRLYLDARGEAFDGDRGFGAAAARRAGVVETPTAAALLQRFARIAHDEHKRRRGPLSGAFWPLVPPAPDQRGRRV